MGMPAGTSGALARTTLAPAPAPTPPRPRLHPHSSVRNPLGSCHWTVLGHQHGREAVLTVCFCKILTELGTHPLSSNQNTFSLSNRPIGSLLPIRSTNWEPAPQCPCTQVAVQPGPQQDHSNF